MFINYYANHSRDNPINIAVLRCFLGLYALWKLISYDFLKLHQFPSFLFTIHPHFPLLGSTIYLNYIWIEVLVTTILILLFIVGYKTAIVSFLAAMLLAHLSAIHYVITNSGATWLPVIYILILFAIYHRSDFISIDGFRRTRTISIEKLNQNYHSKPIEYGHDICKWTLVTIAVIYFFTGYTKLKNVGIEWGYGDHLSRILVSVATKHLKTTPESTKVLLEFPILASIAGVLTLILEAGFVFVVLLKLPITIFVFLLLGMHTMIALTMEVFFFDQYILFSLLLPYDRMYAKIANRDTVTIYCHPNCHLLERCILFLKYFDVNNTLQLCSSPTDIQGKSKNIPTSHFQPLILKKKSDSLYYGYEALVELVAQTKALAWLVNFIRLHAMEEYIKLKFLTNDNYKTI